jgi:hypothetical protein
MFVPFESIASSSRVWIYQSNQKMTADQKQVISNHLNDFTHRWVAHGQPLRSSFLVRHDHFIILAADESFQAASGCSIDDSVRIIKEAGNLTGLDFFDRNKIAFLKDDTVLLLNLPELKQNFKDGIWNETTLTFNNLVTTKNQWENEWLVPAEKTWLKRYVPQETVRLNSDNL